MSSQSKPGSFVKAVLLALFFALPPAAAKAIVLDVFKTSGDGASLITPISTITTIDTAESAADHYDFCSWSGHPKGVPLGPNVANVWVHQDLDDPGIFGIGFLFGQDAPARTPANRAALNFRIVDSESDPAVVVSDDPGEAVETPPGSNAFVGDYRYRDNTDGIMIGNISGGFTFIVDSVDFGSIRRWFAASGDGSHVELELGEEYRITPQGGSPSEVSVTIAEPDAFALFGLGLAGIAFARRKRSVWKCSGMGRRFAVTSPLWNARCYRGFPVQES